MSLKLKIITSQTLVVLLAVTATTVIAGWQSKRGFDRVASEMKRGSEENASAVHDAMISTADASMSQQTRQVWATCAAQDELVNNALKSYVSVAREFVERAGGLALGSETVQWTALNQLTSDRAEMELPKLMLGDAWLGQNTDGGTPTPLVDEVTRVLGCTCTVFQRMNDAGDMLRAATSVKRKDGERAIGTYVPAKNPDGAPNPVVATVLRGERYVGRAFVVDTWYFTAYEPLKDADGKIIGMLYTGIPESFAAALREQIISQKVGKTGYVFVIKGKGDGRGQYVVSKNGARDGESIWETKDATGRLVIQEMCEKALALGPGDVGEIRYEWKNPDDPAPREKIVKLAYYAPWDWVIGAGTYTDEIMEVADDLRRRSDETTAAAGKISDQAKFEAMVGSLAVGGAAVLAGAILAFLIGRSIALPIQRVIRELANGAAQVDSASQQIASASQALAAGATEQASSLEETSAALEESAGMTRANAENAAKANTLARDAHGGAARGGTVVSELDGAMQGISEASSQISKILKVIEEIAFQTNLLALNAAVEAARAGEHGRGFAVVADEVRKLAQRAASAAGEIGELVENASQRSRAGVEIAANVSTALGGIVDQTKRVSELIDSISKAAQEQSQGVNQINLAVSQMDRVTQQNAASAEECAAAAEQLSAQSRTVATMVTTLSGIVGGSRASTATATEATAQPTADTPV